MDLDHLKKLVDASIEEGERLNTDGPEYDRLLEYLNEAHADPSLQRIAWRVTSDVGAMLRKMEAERDARDALASDLRSLRAAHLRTWGVIRDVRGAIERRRKLGLSMHDVTAILETLDAELALLDKETDRG